MEWNVCMYIYIYMYVCMYVCMYVYICMYVCMYVYIYAHFYKDIHRHIKIHIYYVYHSFWAYGDGSVARPCCAAQIPGLEQTCDARPISKKVEDWCHLAAVKMMHLHGKNDATAGASLKLNISHLLGFIYPLVI